MFCVYNFSAKDDFLAAVAGIKTHLMRESQPSKLLYFGELLNGKNFSPKMVRVTIKIYSKPYLKLGKYLVQFWTLDLQRRACGNCKLYLARLHTIVVRFMLYLKFKIVLKQGMEA